MNLVIRDGKNLELKKHVNAIHCSNNLTLVQRKLFNALLFKAYPNLQNNHRFQIKSKELCKLIGYNSKDTGKLKAALLGLITIAIEWNVIDCSTGQAKNWRASSVLASAELSGGVCIYEYSQVMKDFLYQPEIYGIIDIDLISRFKSSYGLALYENCIRYQKLAQTPWFPLDIFRKLMGVFDEKYIAFKDFKKRVLDIAVKEVNFISPILITPEVDRENQKVTSIRFKLEKNKVFTEDMTISKIADDELNTILSSKFGLSALMIQEVFSRYDIQYIRDKVEIIMHSDSFLSGKIRALAGYLIEALRNDYQLNKSSKLVVDEQRKAREVDEIKNRKMEEGAKKRYQVYVAEKINIYLSSLSKTDYGVLLADFEEYMRSQTKILQGWYLKKGLEHPATKASFHSFIKENKKEQIGKLLSMDEFNIEECQ